MSVYSTFFCLDEEDDHSPDCPRMVRTSDNPNVWYHDGRTFRYHGEYPCGCGALRGPYRYFGSNQSLTEDHERTGPMFLCRAVGTNTVRLSLPDGTDTVLLDGRQAQAMRDALNVFLSFHDDPAGYGPRKAWDVADEAMEPA